jgi:hypothetical protein
MKKMSAFERSVLLFMSGPYGRWARGLMGVALLVLAAVGGGWWLLLGLPGLLMIATGIANYCPAGLAMTGSGKASNIMADIAKFDALGSDVHKH